MANVYCDSSDEDVCWGQYTLKEAKKDLKKYIPKNVKRRHSTHLKLNMESSNRCLSTEARKQAEEMKLLKDYLESKLDISSNPSEYLTPNESVETEKQVQNQTFFTKLNQVINEPISEASSYNTAFNHSNAIMDHNNMQRTINDTYFKAIQDMETIGLDISQPTLVENTVFLDGESFQTESCEQLGSKDEFVDSDSFVAVKQESNQKNDIDDSIITVSDDSGSQLQQSASEYVSIEVQTSLDSPVVSNREQLEESDNTDEVYHTNSLHEKSDIETAKLFNSENESYISTTSPLSDQDDKEYSCYVEEHSTTDGCSPNTRGLNLHSWESQNANQFLSARVENETEESFGFRPLSPMSDQEDKEYSCNMQLSSQQHTVNSSKGESSLDTSFKSRVENSYSHHPAENYHKHMNPCSQLTKISEKTEYTTCMSNVANSSEQSQNSTQTRSWDSEINDSSEVYEPKFEESSDVNLSSPIQVPALNLDQFDDSAIFNDTLEEINRFLAQGADEKTSPKVSPTHALKDTIISASFLKNNSENLAPQTKTTPGNKLLKNSIERCKKFGSAEKVTKPRYEIREVKTAVKSKYQMDSKLKPPLISGQKLFTKSAENLKTESAFKVPIKPIKKMHTPIKLHQVVSPVGVYIRNSPKYCPLIKSPHHTGLPHTRTPINVFKEEKSAVKPNIPSANLSSIPQVIYKPAKIKIMTEERNINLPGSIKKLINEQEVTKHEMRTNKKLELSVERRLMESDLSVNNSILNVSHDQSVLINKQAFNFEK